jgi:hypothetical protein
MSGLFRFFAEGAIYAFFARAILLLWRAAVFLWIKPLRAARSRSLVAASLDSAEACGSFAFLSAVRRAERCARLRTVAARDLRMFFLPDAILGTKRNLQMT